MVVFGLLVAIGVFIIHYWNGGSLYELANIASIVFLFWMTDVLVHLHIMSLPVRQQRKMKKALQSFMKTPEGKKMEKELEMLKEQKKTQENL